MPKIGLSRAVVLAIWIMLCKAIYSLQGCARTPLPHIQQFIYQTNVGVRVVDLEIFYSEWTLLCKNIMRFIWFALDQRQILKTFLLVAFKVESTSTCFKGF